jgi:hypothetical protein
LKAFVPFLALAVATLAASASASNLTDVRVGVHGDHTRIVLETDGKAPYIVDAGEKEIIVHVDAAATAEAVTAKSPHLIWVKVEPTQIGADVRLQLKQPADVKALVLTGPDRIVLDVYPRKGTPAPLPAPTLVPEEAPAPTAEAEPAIPLEPQEMEPSAPPEQATPGAEELAANAELEQAAAQAEAETPMVVGEEAAAPEASEAAPEAAPETPTEDVAQAPVTMDEAPQSPVTPAAPAPSGSGFGSQYLLAAAAVVLFFVYLYLRRRLRSAEQAPRPVRRDEPPAPFEPAQRAVPVGAPSASGESLFDVESEAIGPPPKDEEAAQGLRRASVGADAGDDSERRMAHLERRIEELVDARERLERQVAAQTEELRVQRAAIARTQRVLRTVAPRTEEEGSSGEPLKS